MHLWQIWRQDFTSEVPEAVLKHVCLLLPVAADVICQCSQTYTLLFHLPLGIINLCQNPKHHIMRNIAERVLCYIAVHHSASKQDRSFY